MNDFQLKFITIEHILHDMNSIKCYFLMTLHFA